MKKILLIIAAIIINAGAYAQSDADSTRNRVKMSPPDINNYSNEKSSSDKTRDGNSLNQNNNNNANPVLQNNPDSIIKHETLDTSNPDGVMMKDGKMLVVKNGKTVPMDREIAMSNGTKIQINGTIVKRDGSKGKIKEGEYINLSGKTVPGKK